MTAQAAGTSPAANARADDQQHLMLAGLWSMRRDLKDIKSIERKIDYKRKTALPQLMDYVDGVVKADQGGQNDVITNAMIWLFDIGDLHRGLHVADYVIRHGLEAPDRYERDSITIVAEEVAERLFDRLKEIETQDQTPDSDALKALEVIVRHVEELIDDRDLHDQVTAKVYKAHGYIARELGNNKTALRYLRRAVELHEHIGVKKDVERLERAEKKNAAGST